VGKYDKDRFQKELAVRYCIARGLMPFVEVIVRSVADVSESVEVLTDLDVIGIGATGDGRLHRTLFDCKTTSKMSPINRALWAAGVKEYTGCDEAYVLLKNKAVHNHRISALSVNVDLHDEDSFKDLGRTFSASFPTNECYQGDITRWNELFESFRKTGWSEGLFDLARNATPLSRSPWSTFRKIVAELRNTRGLFDPNKGEHLGILFDVLASTFVLWAAMARDIRRFYEPAMDKAAFEKTLRYYIWGGKEAYSIRQQMRDRSTSEQTSAVELPSWNLLVSFAGLIISSPQSVLDCAFVCREIALKTASGANAEFDRELHIYVQKRPRVRQFTTSLSDYLVAAGTLPKEFASLAQEIVLKL
jgi:hypothetical protein